LSRSAWLAEIEFTNEETVMNSMKVHGRYYQLHPPEHFKGFVEEDFEVNFDRSAFLVVDIYGHGFSNTEETKNHPSFTDDENKPWDDITLNCIQPALDAARLAGMPVVYAHNSAPNIAINRSQFGKVMGRTLQTDMELLLSERPDKVDPHEYVVSEGAHLLDIAPAVAPKPGDYYIRKHFYSGFKDTRLDTLLRNLDVKSLFCAGFDVSVCLLCTLIDAWELNYEVILLRDAVRAIEIPEDIHIGYSFTERMIKWIESMVGYSITTRQFLELMTTIKPEVHSLIVKE
jgi:nicotinamidase-related amidase